MREDISVLAVPEGRASRLRPDKLSPIEKATQTLAFFDDGGGSAIDEGCRRLLICGANVRRRELASEWIQSVLDAADFVMPVAEPLPERHASGMALSRPFSHYGGSEERETKVAKVAKSNPKEVLETMSWPQNINQWGLVQKKVWVGHPPIQKGWIRIWSKSKDLEYYLRLKDATTTFDLEDVRD